MASGSFYTSLKPKLRVSPFGSRSIYRVTHAFSRTLVVLVERSLTLRYTLSLSRVWSMASVAGTAITIPAWPRRQSLQVFNGLSGLKLVSFSSKRKSFPLIQLHPSPMCFRVSCAAKQETLKKVCGIVKKQLALPEGTSVTGESKFATLGADSLDTVEIVMGLEEAFGINVEEESAQSIVTVQDAADLIEKLIKEKSG